MSSRSREWLEELLHGIADRGRELLGGRTPTRPGHDAIVALMATCRELLSERGEARGTALACEAVDRYRSLSPDQTCGFFVRLCEDFGPDRETVHQTFENWRAQPSPAARQKLMSAIEGDCQRLFRRMNMAPGGTEALVAMRARLIECLRDNPMLDALDDDLRHLLGSWFNRGFLEFQKIDWATPALVLEKLISYEAVHAIRGWDDLRRRLAPDRRCYGFFHPALPNEPLIFVEVALVSGLATAIHPIIDAPMPARDHRAPDTAIFYSISNCQPGLRGISFGNFLIKQVVDELKREHPDLKMFSTLSPVPGFRRWYEALRADDLELALGPHIAPLRAVTGAADTGEALVAMAKASDTGALAPELTKILERLCAYYLCALQGGPTDTVARFHLGNGARLQQVNSGADLSAHGRRQSFGIMVNYLYKPEEIIANHEDYVARKQVARSTAVNALLGSRPATSSRPRALSA